jgi:ferredoxin
MGLITLYSPIAPLLNPESRVFCWIAMVEIDESLCVGCGSCTLYCPVEALTLVDRKARVNLVLCVECGTCIRAEVCPVDAISMPEFDEIRETRHYLSDPTTTKKLTGVPGRGTEEVKTNDVTGRIKRGEAGICVELGRPGVGTSFRDVEKVTRALAELGVQFEEMNPVTALIVDESGALDEGIVDERVLSGIVEAKIEEERLPEVIGALRRLEGELDTVFSLGVICRFDEEGGIPALKIIEGTGVEVRPNSKVNVGLGRPLSEA